MPARTSAILAAFLALAACGDIATEPTPSEQLDRDLQRVAEDAVKDIDTTGFDALE